MSKFDEQVAACKAQMDKQGIKCDARLLSAIAKSLGPALYNRDARTVAAGQKSELETIKKNFLIKKLGCKEGDPGMDKAIQNAIDKIGRSNRAKLRAVFYYLLVKELRKASVFK